MFSAARAAPYPACRPKTAPEVSPDPPAPAPPVPDKKKKKPKFTMRDDGDQVEVFLPLPPGVSITKQIKVKATKTALKVWHVAESSNSADKQLLYVRDNITTTEVSIARVYNYDVEKRRMDMLNADIDAVKVAAA